MPATILSIVKKRAILLTAVRSFFSIRDVMEVEVPVIGSHSVTDPNLQALSLEVNGQLSFLQTSPEYFMKRLLAQGAGAMYYLGKAFRNEERGSQHRPEFTMLEWYRLGFDDEQLANEVLELVTTLCSEFDVPEPQRQRCSYGMLFEQYTGLNPHLANAAQLRDCAQQHLDVPWEDDDKNTWLDLLFTHLVEPRLGEALTVVYDFPASQCALAKIAESTDGQPVAKRFEVYWRGLELANGYWELTDAEIQRERFVADNIKRRDRGIPQIPLDEKFLEALELGVPECAGVALGVDRLLMALLGAKEISKVLPFG